MDDSDDTRPRRRRVAVIATGFAVRDDALDAGIARLRRMGFDPVEGATARARRGYLAGSDDQGIIAT